METRTNLSQPKSSLPLDIYHDIAAALAFQSGGMNGNALSALSRSCRFMKPICQRYIFEKISLRPLICDGRRRVATNNESSAPSISFEKLERILQRNPAIAGYIRTLIYNSHPSNLVDNRVADLLDTLTRVQTLNLTFYFEMSEFDIVFPEGWEEEPYGINAALALDWKAFPAKLRKSLERLINLPTLYNLDMEQTINFPMDVLARAPNLRSLRIAHSRLLPATCRPRPTKHIPPQLQSLHLVPGEKTNVHTLKTLFAVEPPIMDVSHLQKMTFDFINVTDENQFDDLLKLGLDHLESLTLNFGYIWCPDLTVLSSALSTAGRTCAVPNLRHLTIISKLHPCPGGFPKSGKFFFEIIKDVPRWNHLESVDMTFEVFPHISGPHVWDIKRVDRHLCDPNVFPALRKVSLEAHMVEFEEDDEEKDVWWALRENYLDNLPESETIDFKYEVDDCHVSPL